jgi:hypothetical protein
MPTSGSLRDANSLKICKPKLQGRQGFAGPKQAFEESMVNTALM